MTGAHLWLLVSAEVRKLFSRTSARVGLVLAGLIGIGVPVVRALWRLAEHSMVQALAEANDVPVPELPGIEADYIVYVALWLRNFFFLRVLLIMLAALIFAGEFQTRALREDLLRPVPRWSVLLSKWLALVVWITATVGVTLVPSTLVSMLAWGVDGDWGQVLLGYLATIATDAGFAALALAVAVASRSVAGTIVGMVLFYLVDFALYVGLMAVANVPFIQVPDWTRTMAEEAGPYLPSAAFGAWTGAGASDWAWQGFLSLALVTLLSLAFAQLVFRRMDVP